MSVSQSSEFLSHEHLPLGDDHRCPWCDQQITRDKLEEIKERIRAEERARTEAIQRDLSGRFARDLAQAQAKAKAELEAERRQTTATLDKVQRDAAAKQALLTE